MLLSCDVYKNWRRIESLLFTWRYEMDLLKREMEMKKRVSGLCCFILLKDTSPFSRFSAIGN